MADSLATDFGRVVKGSPRKVFVTRRESEVFEAFEHCRRQGLSLSLRGRGHSVNGLTVNPGGAVLLHRPPRGQPRRRSEGRIEVAGGNHLEDGEESAAPTGSHDAGPAGYVEPDGRGNAVGRRLRRSLRLAGRAGGPRREPEDPPPRRPGRLVRRRRERRPLPIRPRRSRPPRGDRPGRPAQRGPSANDDASSLSPEVDGRAPRVVRLAERARFRPPGALPVGLDPGGRLQEPLRLLPTTEAKTEPPLGSPPRPREPSSDGGVNRATAACATSGSRSGWLAGRAVCASGPTIYFPTRRSSTSSPRWSGSGARTVSPTRWPPSTFSP